MQCSYSLVYLLEPTKTLTFWDVFCRFELLFWRNTVSLGARDRGRTLLLSRSLQVSAYLYHKLPLKTLTDLLNSERFRILGDVIVGCGLFCKFWGSKYHNWPQLYFGKKGQKTQKLTKFSPIWSGAELSKLGHSTNEKEKSRLLYWPKTGLVYLK